MVSLLVRPRESVTNGFRGTILGEAVQGILTKVALSWLGFGQRLRQGATGAILVSQCGFK